MYCKVPYLCFASSRESWYAVYTKPRREKKIYDQLLRERIEDFLPMRTIVRQWSDRKKQISEPLFSCYLFVFISMKDYFRVLNLEGVVRYVTIEGRAVKIPDKQIMLIRDLLDQKIDIEETAEPIPIGSQVEIRSGFLNGIRGELVDFAGRKRVIIRMEEIKKTLFINAPLAYVKLAN